MTRYSWKVTGASVDQLRRADKVVSTGCARPLCGAVAVLLCCVSGRISAQLPLSSALCRLVGLEMRAAQLRLRCEAR